MGGETDNDQIRNLQDQWNLSPNRVQEVLELRHQSGQDGEIKAVVREEEMLEREITDKLATGKDRSGV